LAEREMSRGSSRRPLLYACFFGSGAAGLILEVVWSKYLSLLLGNSIYGVSTVVAAFLGGLGIGAAIGGRLAARAKEPLLAYARLELLVAALGLASPLAFAAARPIFAALNALLLGHGNVFLVLRFLVLFAALLTPTTAMGATLPLIVSDFSRRDPKGADSATARLYAVNTAGAVLGVALAGFVAIPAIGLWKSAALAAGIDLVVAIAVWLGRPGAPPAARERAPEREASRGARGAGPAPRFAGWILPVFAISGFTAILYEVAWTRILSVPFGGMVYAFSAILAIYLIGIALGASAASRLLKVLPAPVLLFGVLQGGLAAAVAAGTHLFERVPHWQARAIARSFGNTFDLLASEAVIAAKIILPAALLLGALFPTAVAIYQRRRGDAGASVGSVYAANTVGSIAGSLLTAFLLIPWIGSLHAILVAAALNAGIAVAALLFADGPRIAGRALAGVVAVAAGLFATLWTPTWNAERMSIGLVRLLRSHWFGGESLTHRMIDRIGSSSDVERLLFYKEGRLAAVAVVEVGQRRALIINGKTDATTGSGEDMAQQVLMGQLPLLFAPEAKDVCVVGYGSGVTTYAVMTHPVRDVLTIELEGAVIEAAPFFRADAHDPLSDPRSRLLVEDAGTYLRSTPRKYDLILSEPSNLWIAGMADLFTTDFYRAARARLAPGGLFSQWVQCYQASPVTLGTVFRTLVTRFPHGQLFYVDGSADLIVLASPDRAVPVDLDLLARGFQNPKVAQNLARVGINSLADLLRCYRGRLERAAADAGPGPVNTDDNAWLEHHAPFDLLKGGGADSLMMWSPQVAEDLAASIVSDRSRAEAVLAEAADRAWSAGDTRAASGLHMARDLVASAPGRGAGSASGSGAGRADRAMRP
jgi:spermidine synthase